MAKSKVPAKKAKPVKKSTPAKKAASKPAMKVATKKKPAVKAKAPKAKVASSKSVKSKPATAMPKLKPSAGKSKPAIVKAQPSKAAVKSVIPKTATIIVKAVASAPAKTESFFKSYLKPLDDRIVVVVDKAETMTPGGLYIPATVTDTAGNYEGKVMAIGRGHMNKKGKIKPLDVSIGDKVVFSVFSGSHIDVEGNSIMVIRESDVLGIVK